MATSISPISDIACYNVILEYRPSMIVIADSKKIKIQFTYLYDGDKIKLLNWGNFIYRDGELREFRGRFVPGTYDTISWIFESDNTRILAINYDEIRNTKTYSEYIGSKSLENIKKGEIVRLNRKSYICPAPMLLLSIPPI